MAAVFGQSDCRIIITTPGYGSIYRYAPEEFAAQMASDFKIEGVTVDYATLSEGCKRLKLHIGRKDFVFSITSQSPVARLTYDRNRRQFKGIGFNYIEYEGVRYEAPSFKGLTVEKLSEAWQPQIERLIENRSLLEEGKPNVFLLEADIDEQGNVVGIDTVVVSIMHSADFPIEALRKYVRENVIAPVLERYGFHIENVAHIHINPTGNFVIGGANGGNGGELGGKQRRRTPGSVRQPCRRAGSAVSQAPLCRVVWSRQ